MSYILSASTVFPKYKYTQGQTMDLLATIWPEQARVIQKIHKNTMVETRHLALPLERYLELTDFGMRNNLWIENALPLAESAAKSGLAQAQLGAEDIDMIVSTSITGIAVPSLEARLMNRMPFKTTATRMPVFGLGCLGGAATIARAHDYLKGHPRAAVLVLATELCSLTFQFDDVSMANLVATGLFADGAAAVVLVGEEHPKAKDGKLRIIDTMSVFYPNTEITMGWDITGNGFKIVLAGDVPSIVNDNVPGGTGEFLSRNNMDLDQVAEVIAHPGGPKVLKALAQALERNDQDFSHSWNSLAENGNMSSVSVLDILARTLNVAMNAGDKGLLMAMGPAFCSEMVLTERCA